MKRLISTALCLALTLSLLSVSAAAEPPHTRTTKLTLSVSSSSSNPLEGWSWDHETLALTLEGIDFAIAGDGGIRLPDGGDEFVTLALTGSNSISIEGSGGYHAISADGKLRVAGSGSLTVSGGLFGLFGRNSVEIASGNLSLNNVASLGIYGDGDVAISGGTVTCAGSDYGGIASEGSLLISGGNVTVRDTDYYGIGSNDFSITGGTVTVDGCPDGLLCMKGIITITGGYTAITNAQEGYIVLQNDSILMVDPSLPYDESEAGLFIGTPASTSGDNRTFAAERAEETEAWQQLRDEAADSADGATISFDAKFYDTVPCWFVDSLAGKNVFLKLTWRDENGVRQTATLDCAMFVKTAPDRIFYSIADLAALYQ